MGTDWKHKARTGWRAPWAGLWAVALIAACSSGGGGGSGTPVPPPSSAPTILVGTGAAGVAHNAPADWPAQAGNWNARGARYHAASDRLVFETYRDDIRGGSIPDASITAAGVTE
jgi:hypothetical protein